MRGRHQLRRASSLGRLFTAHITGNLVILATHVATGGEAPVAHMMSVTVFIVVLGRTRLLAGGLDRVRVASPRPLLVLQFLLLSGFLVLCVAAGPRIDPNAANAIVAGMLGASAMAVQNALVQISLKGAPSTAVMTTDITRFTMDLGEMKYQVPSDAVAKPPQLYPDEIEDLAAYTDLKAPVYYGPPFRNVNAAS